MSKNYEEAVKVLARFKTMTAELKEVSQELNAAVTGIPANELMQFQRLMTELIQSVS